MVKKTRIFWFFLVGLGLLLFAFSGCKKDKSDPIITWTIPADISYGTLLSTIQSNATSNIPGTFVYTPAIGAKLNAGANQTLKVDFIPSDAGTYNSVSKTVNINVKSSGITFNPNLTYGSVTDQDGNVYKTITIGMQTWMAENLRTTKYRNGEAIPNVTVNKSWGSLLTGAYCNYNNTSSIDTIATFGRLYNWYAATDFRNIAPLGWHVPSDSEWGVLSNFIGKTFANHKLKEAGLAHWTSTNNDDNTSGFTAFPCGFRYEDSGVFAFYDNQAFWLSSTKFNTTSSCYCWIYDGFGLIDIGPAASGAGWSVRCVKD